MTQPPSGAQTSPRPRISEEDRIARLQLRSPRVGPATYKRLMAAHGSAAEALKAARFGPQQRGQISSTVQRTYRTARIFLRQEKCVRSYL